VKVPVIAAGGIADARGIVAAFALGAAAVQIGTAYLPCPEAKVGPVHRMALKNTTGSQTTLTNIFTGRPGRAIVNRAIRELGPISDNVPDFRSLPQLWGRFAQKPRRQDRVTSPHCGPVKRRAFLASFPRQS